MSQKGSGYPFVLGTSLGCSAWSPLVLAPAEAKPSVLPAEKKPIESTRYHCYPSRKKQTF